MPQTTIALAALLGALSVGAQAEPPTMEPLRRAAAGEMATVVDGTLIRDGAVRNDSAVKGALTVPEAAPMRVGAPVDLTARPMSAPPAPRRERESFFSGFLNTPGASAGVGALIGGVIGFFVGGGLWGAVAGAAIGALLGWGLSKLLGGKNG